MHIIELFFIHRLLLLISTTEIISVAVCSPASIAVLELCFSGGEHV